MKLAYIRWRDATHGIEEIAAEDADLVELHEIGFVAADTDEAITLTMEHCPGAKTFRLWLTIPKVNILETRYVEFSALKNKTRSKRCS